jgi:hydrogenase expression/formation protein HypC
MCLGIPGELQEPVPDQPDLAWADVSGARRVVNIGLLRDEGVVSGDWVLIHVGFAMAKIDEHEARLALGMLKGTGRAYADELSALSESDVT